MFRLRAQQIIIDLPTAESEPWVHIAVQRIRIEEDGSETRTVDRWGSVSKKLSDVSGNIYQFDEYESLSGGEISGSGISNAITSAALVWIAEKYNGRIEDGNVLID